MSGEFDRGRYDGAETPEQMERDQRRKALFAELGITVPDFESEKSAPAITDEIRRDLLALARGELEGEELRRVVNLIRRYRSLARLYGDMSAAEYRREQADLN